MHRELIEVLSPPQKCNDWIRSMRLTLTPRALSLGLGAREEVKEGSEGVLRLPRGLHPRGLEALVGRFAALHQVALRF